jgi:hypothetical protein
MATTNPFQNVSVKAGDAQRSINWYRTQVNQLRNVSGSVNSMLSGKAGNLRSRINPGELYLFQYDAKHKNDLPYWDAMPLVLPFSTVAGGFLGINLHYLPYGLRFKLMGALLDVKNKTADENKQQLFSWQLLNSGAKFPGVQACVKHYLTGHLRSRFLLIPSDDWLSASMMPLEQFQNASKEAVWRQSRKYY